MHAVHKVTQRYAAGGRKFGTQRGGSYIKDEGGEAGTPGVRERGGSYIKDDGREAGTTG